MRTFSLPIIGMTCGGCAAAVTQALQKVPGVLRVEVQLTDKCAVITANEQLQQSALDEALNRAGFRRGPEIAQA